MTPKLDSSHKCVLEHLESFRRAERCLKQTLDYLEQVVREITVSFPSRAGLSLKWEVKLLENSYLMAVGFPNWQGSQAYLLSVGIEDLTIDNLVDPKSPRCQAFVFSAVLEGLLTQSLSSGLERRLRGLPHPVGFGPVAPDQSGYLFRKPLDCLSAESFCSAQGLADHLREPLTVLLAWLADVTPIVESLRSNPVSSPAEAGNP